MAHTNKLSNTLERELELNGLEAADELPVNSINQQGSNDAAEQTPTCYYCKKALDIINHNAEK